MIHSDICLGESLDSSNYVNLDSKIPEIEKSLCIKPFIIKKIWKGCKKGIDNYYDYPIHGEDGVRISENNRDYNTLDLIKNENQKTNFLRKKMKRNVKSNKMLSNPLNIFSKDNNKISSKSRINFVNRSGMRFYKFEAKTKNSDILENNFLTISGFDGIVDNQKESFFIDLESLEFIAISNFMSNKPIDFLSLNQKVKNKNLICSFKKTINIDEKKIDETPVSFDINEINLCNGVFDPNHKISRLENKIEVSDIYNANKNKTNNENFIFTNSYLEGLDLENTERSNNNENTLTETDETRENKVNNLIKALEVKDPDKEFDTVIFSKIFYRLFENFKKYLDDKNYLYTEFRMLSNSKDNRIDLNFLRISAISSKFNSEILKRIYPRNNSSSNILLYQKIEKNNFQFNFKNCENNFLKTVKERINYITHYIRNLKNFNLDSTTLLKEEKSVEAIKYIKVLTKLISENQLCSFLFCFRSNVYQCLLKMQKDLISNYIKIINALIKQLNCQGK